MTTKAATTITGVVTDDQPRTYFDCEKCPAFCCSVYERVQVTDRDLKRLAKHFGVSEQTALRRYTRITDGERVLKRTHDPVFERDACMFLDRETRGCSIYPSRPKICRTYPARTRCAYYDLWRFEVNQQDDPNVLTLVQITFRDMK